MSFLNFLQIISGVLGVSAFAWRVFDSLRSYLKIAVSVNLLNINWITILTSVENKGATRKDIGAAFLLIGPESESPIETSNLLLKHYQEKFRISYTNELIKVSDIRNDTKMVDGCRMFLPLPFFYSENIAVGDETLSYRSALNISEFPVAVPFSVRFYVFGRNRLHRSTHDCFLVDRSTDQN
jgi:hypothetical protein